MFMNNRSGLEITSIFQEMGGEYSPVGSRQAAGLCVRTGLAGWGIVGLRRGHCSFLNPTFLVFKMNMKSLCQNTTVLWGARMVAALVRGRGRRDVSGHGAPGMLPWFPFLSWAWLTQSCSLWEHSSSCIYPMIWVLFWSYICIVQFKSSLKWLLFHKITGGTVFENILKYGDVHSNFTYQPLQKFEAFLLSNLPPLLHSPSPLPCISEQL